MKPVKDNLKNEIIYRIDLLEKLMDELKKTKEENGIYSFLVTEYSNYKEFLLCIEYYERLEIKKNYDISKSTPLICKSTGVPLMIGDKVEKESLGNKACGFLYWDDCFNEYLIKTESGGNIRFSEISKISELYNNEIDITRVECRSKQLKRH
ncbi:hypothetical protein R5N98_02785 [Tenacibaculum maritimum]|uniref:hypothetical protein n=2 Tax=Tenacibaculum maritimum TaxID=107401 RepID=UPI0038770317